MSAASRDKHRIAGVVADLRYMHGLQNRLLESGIGPDKTIGARYSVMRDDKFIQFLERKKKTLMLRNLLDEERANNETSVLHTLLKGESHDFHSHYRIDYRSGHSRLKRRGHSCRLDGRILTFSALHKIKSKNIRCRLSACMKILFDAHAANMTGAAHSRRKRRGMHHALL